MSPRMATTSARLHRTFINEPRLLGLEVNEHEPILRALNDPPAGLTELRQCRSGSFAERTSQPLSLTTRNLAGRGVWLAGVNVR